MFNANKGNVRLSEGKLVDWVSKLFLALQSRREQRLIRLIKMTTWRDVYNAALLESDWTKVEERIQAAESEIHKRLELSQGTEEERDALANALNGLKTLRTDVTAWLDKQRDRKVQP